MASDAETANPSAANSGDAVSHDDEGVVKFARNDYDGAIMEFSRAIELSPDWASAYYHRAGPELSKDDFDGAISDWDKAILLKADYGEAYSTRAVAKFAKDDYDGAISDCTRAIGLNPNFAGCVAIVPESYKREGVRRMNKHDYDGAIANFTKAIELRPGEAEMYNWRGQARGSTADKDDAIADFRSW